jgi:hypothetical protein
MDGLETSAQYWYLPKTTPVLKSTNPESTSHSGWMAANADSVVIIRKVPPDEDTQKA